MARCEVSGRPLKFAGAILDSEVLERFVKSVGSRFPSMPQDGMSPLVAVIAKVPTPVVLVGFKRGRGVPPEAENSFNPFPMRLIVSEPASPVLILCAEEERVHLQ